MFLKKINNKIKKANVFNLKLKLKQMKSASISKSKIQLKNIDKFNIDFVEYMKKKSYRRIEK